MAISTLCPVRVSAFQYPETFYDQNGNKYRKIKRGLKVIHPDDQAIGVTGDGYKFHFDIAAQMQSHGFTDGTMGLGFTLQLIYPLYTAVKITNEEEQALFVIDRTQVQSNLFTRGRLDFEYTANWTENHIIIPKFAMFLYEETVQHFVVSGF